MVQLAYKLIKKHVKHNMSPLYPVNNIKYLHPADWDEFAQVLGSDWEAKERHPNCPTSDERLDHLKAVVDRPGIRESIENASQRARARNTMEKISKRGNSNLPRSLYVAPNGEVYIRLQKRVSSGAQKYVNTIVNVKTGEIFAKKVTISPESRKGMISEYRDTLQFPSHIVSRPIEGTLRVTAKKVSYLEPLMLHGDLQHYANSSHRYQSGHSLTTARQMAQQVAYLHQRHFLHRDIKPQNIFVQRINENGAPELRLGDCGEAVHMNDLERKGNRVGTMRFLSPEYLKALKSRNPKEIAAATTVKHDSWQLGLAMLFALPEATRDFISRAPGREHLLNLLAVDPDHRVNMTAFYESINESNWTLKPEEDGVAFAIFNLLRLNPKDRWTAEEAYRYLEKLEKAQLKQEPLISKETSFSAKIYSAILAVNQFLGKIGSVFHRIALFFASLKGVVPQEERAPTKDELINRLRTLHQGLNGDFNDKGKLERDALKALQTYFQLLTLYPPKTATDRYPVEIHNMGLDAYMAFRREKGASGTIDAAKHLRSYKGNPLYFKKGVTELFEKDCGDRLTPVEICDETKGTAYSTSTSEGKEGETRREELRLQLQSLAARPGKKGADAQLEMLLQQSVTQATAQFAENSVFQPVLDGILDLSEKKEMADGFDNSRLAFAFEDRTTKIIKKEESKFLIEISYKVNVGLPPSTLPFSTSGAKKASCIRSFHQTIAFELNRDPQGNWKSSPLEFRLQFEDSLDELSGSSSDSELSSQRISGRDSPEMISTDED